MEERKGGRFPSTPPSKCEVYFLNLLISSKFEYKSSSSALTSKSGNCTRITNMEDLYRTGFAIALVVHSVDSVQSFDLLWSRRLQLSAFYRHGDLYRTRYPLARSPLERKNGSLVAR